MIRCAAIMALAACSYDASFSDCAISCATAGCPTGLACGTEGLCRRPGQTRTCATILGDAGIDATPASCRGLAATCGPTGSDDCCSTATPIPGGTFYRSYDVAGDGMYPDMSYPATVSPFVLDKYTVTVGRFRAFVEAGMGTQVNPPMAGAGARRLNGLSEQGGWDPSWNANLAANTSTLVADIACDTIYQSWTNTVGANENLPMNCITWYEAFAFCVWDDGYLPSEAEWNFAAAGGNEQRAYPWSTPPWSTTIDCSYANFVNGSSFPADTCVNPGTGSVNHVGSESPKGDSGWRQADLGGNLFNWVLDWYASPYPQSTCVDCANLTPAAYRGVRGGSFSNTASPLRTGYRGFVAPFGRGNFNGIRCARSKTP
jgi:formylglycine-generating enzyme